MSSSVSNSLRNDSLRASLQASTPSLLYHASPRHRAAPSNVSVESIIRRSTIMTDRGPAVLLPPERIPIPFSDSDDEEEDNQIRNRNRQRSVDIDRQGEEEERSPIAQMLYSRWLMSLREQCRSFMSLTASHPIVSLMSIHSCATVGL